MTAPAQPSRGCPPGSGARPELPGETCVSPSIPTQRTAQPLKRPKSKSMTLAIFPMFVNPTFPRALSSIPVRSFPKIRTPFPAKGCRCWSFEKQNVEAPSMGSGTPCACLPRPRRRQGSPRVAHWSASPGTCSDSRFAGPPLHVTLRLTSVATACRNGVPPGLPVSQAGPSAWTGCRQSEDEGFPYDSTMAVWVLLSMPLPMLERRSC